MRQFLVVTCVLLTGVFLFGLAHGLDQGLTALAFFFFPICWIGLVVASIARIMACFRTPSVSKARYIWTAFYSVVLVLLFLLAWMAGFNRPDPEYFVNVMFAALVCVPSTMVTILHTVEQKRLARPQIDERKPSGLMSYPMESENSWFKGHHHPWLSLAIGFCAAGGYAFATDLYWYRLESDLAFTIMVGPVAGCIVYVLVAVLQCLFDFLRYVFYKSET